MSKRDDLTEKVMRALVDVWPDHMTVLTGSGLQFGQMVAHVAVAALEEELGLEDQR